ncbi:hypothetical protein GCM10009661_83250 [Catellatospora chokoriensis]
MNRQTSGSAHIEKAAGASVGSNGRTDNRAVRKTTVDTGKDYGDGTPMSAATLSPGGVSGGFSPRETGKCDRVLTPGRIERQA